MTARQKVGWKVLNSNSRRSCFVRGRGLRHYRKGRRIIPVKDCGPLCVFTKKYHARRFLENFVHSAYVVKCLYTPSKEVVVWGAYNAYLLQLPQGTALADSVTCLE